MKTNLFAICLTLISFSVIAQEETPQTSPSDETIVVPSEVAPGDATEPLAAPEATLIGSSLPMVQSAGCIQMMPADCCGNGVVMPVVYQQQINSSPLPSTPVTPSPIANQIGSSSVLQTPITTTQPITPIQQSSPFIQPGCCNSGQMVGNQVSSPTTFSSPTTSPIITPVSSAPIAAPIAATTTPTTIVPANTTIPTTTSVDGNWVEPSTNWYPATSFNYGNSGCCPQSRGFIRSGRFFGRRR